MRIRLLTAASALACLPLAAPARADTVTDWWTLANRYVPELTDAQQQRYGLALAPTATPPAR